MSAPAIHKNRVTPCRKAFTSDPAAHDTLWFASPGSSEERKAKTLCMDCPVYWECQEMALETGIPEGVFGGLGKTDRERIWHQIGAKPRTFIDDIAAGARRLVFQERKVS